MKVIYSGKTRELTPELETKVANKLAKLAKLIEQRGEREAHVTHHFERHLHRVCIEVQFYDHTLIGEGTDADLDTALCHAIEKIETQAVKQKTRWRDTHRDARGVRSVKETADNNAAAGEDVEPAKRAMRGAASANGAARPKVFRVDYTEDRKPMTLDEALLEMRDGHEYLVYRDSARDCLSVLVRRPDGNFDLIES